jgi:DNA polymerase V
MIALADCNNFHASCERVFRPELEGKPVLVLSNNDGCVIARSNEVKALGIKMGEPAFKIKDKIDAYKVNVFSTNFTLYGDMSKRVMNILRSESDDIEIYSIDEAFMDFQGIGGAEEKAILLREKVKQWSGIPISIGLAETKVLAKIANHVAKKHRKNGVFVLHGEDLIRRALNYFPVEDLWGVGSKTAKFLKQRGIKTALQLSQCDECWIKRNLSITGLKLVKELKGIPCFPLEQTTPRKKNICTSRSFGNEVNDLGELKESVSSFASMCASKLRKQKSVAKKISVFIITNPFKPQRKQYNGHLVLNFQTATNDTLEIVQMAIKGLESIYREDCIYKKAGVIVHATSPEEEELQLSMFDHIDRHKRKDLMHAYDIINHKMGRDTVRLSVQGYDRKWRLKQEQLSPCYTTRMTEILEVKL